MGRYVLSDQAASDLAKIEDGHLERGGSQEKADLLIMGFLESFQTLADYPEVGTPRFYLKENELSLPHGNYVIVYRQRSKELIDILHVVWGRMNLPAYFKDLPEA